MKARSISPFGNTDIFLLKNSSCSAQSVSQVSQKVKSRSLLSRIVAGVFLFSVIPAQAGIQYLKIIIGNDLPSKGGQAKLPERSFPIWEMDSYNL